jgi:hypothetical protein
MTTVTLPSSSSKRRQLGQPTPIPLIHLDLERPGGAELRHGNLLSTGNPYLQYLQPQTPWRMRGRERYGQT